MNRRILALIALAAGCKASAPGQTAAPNGGGLYFPIASYRIGPYAAGGSGLVSGVIDYFQLVNLRDGGVNGVKLTWQECETEYVVERGVECYERLKKPFKGSPPAAFLPMSVGIMYALDEKARVDKIPLSNLAGRIEAADGRVLPYSFPILLTGYSEMSGIISYIAEREGGKDKLAGKTIAVLYHGSPYGKDTIPLVDALARKYGFTAAHIEVAHPGTDQQAQWLKIRQARPTWVILRGWGVMNPVALKTAAKVGYPIDHIIGNVWSDSEEDVTPAGAAGKGYVAITGFPSGRDFPVIGEIEKYVVSAGKSSIEDTRRVGSVYYNVGVAFGIINVEAARVAQAKFGNRPLNGQEFQWGLEHVSFDDARLAALGAIGFVPRFSLSCRNHDGDGAFKFQQWDGLRWKVISDWIHPNRALIRSLTEESGARYATEHKVTPRNCDAETALN